MRDKDCPPGVGPWQQFDRDLAKGITKIIILSYIKKTKTYPYELLKHIKNRNGFLAGFLTKNDIYNMTASLEKEGFVKSHARLSGNKVKKWYTLTAKGDRVVKYKDKVIGNMLIEVRRMIKEEFNG